MFIVGHHQMVEVVVVVIEIVAVIPEHNLAKAAIAERMDSAMMGILVVPTQSVVVVVVPVMLDTQIQAVRAGMGVKVN
jgi:hypothetical protein